MNNVMVSFNTIMEQMTEMSQQKRSPDNKYGVVIRLPFVICCVLSGFITHCKFGPFSKFFRKYLNHFVLPVND